MPKKCPVCDQKYELETGFYWGAMYVSYAIASGAMLIQAGINACVFDMELYPSFGLICALGLLFWPYMFRVSRSLWINFFVSYDKNFNKKR